MAHYGSGEAWRAQIDESVEQWRQRCLIEDGSLFFADREVWTADAIDTVIARVIDDPLEGAGATFVEKLQRQLEAENLAVRTLAYEVVAVHFLFPASVRGDQKRAVISSLRPPELSSPNERERNFGLVLDSGIGSGGTRFNIARDLQIGVFLRFAGALKALALERRRGTLTDPWACQALLDGLPGRNEPSRHILLHLLHPDVFERMASGNDKRAITRALSETGDPADLDRRLLAIRSRLQAESEGSPIDFYEPPVLGWWSAASDSPGVLAVYVGKDSLTNFELAWEQEHRWGFKNANAATRGVQPGDRIVFAVGVRGGPRKNAADWRAAELRRIAVGRITTPVTTDTARVWPSERPATTTVWPEVLEFEPVVSYRDVGTDAQLLSQELSEALRLAGVNNRPVRLAADISPILLEVVEPVVDDPVESPATLGSAAGGFVDAVSRSELRFGDAELPRAFLAALVAKRFVLLAGLSGSGKTQIAKRLGQWFSTATDKRYAVVPVRPDWTSPDAVLGYEDALAVPTPDGRRPWYVTDVMRLARAALDNPGAPHLLVLDEMNLAHVERYFADILSGIESGEEVVPDIREEDDGRWRQDPAGSRLVALPHNLFVVGTVNIDETTVSFSPKVLDRAFVFEFDVPTSELTLHLRPLKSAPVGKFAHLAAITARSKDVGWHLNEPHPEAQVVFDVLKTFHGHLSEVGLAFGHRTVHESLRFAAAAHAVGIDDLSYVLDRIALTKLLPRVHGPWRALRATIGRLREACEDPQPGTPLMQVTADKLRRLERQGETAQYVNFLG